MKLGNLIALFCACSLYGFVLTANAQQRTVHQLRSVDGQLSANKLFHAVVHEVDPGALCSFHNDGVKVSIDNTISADQLVDRLLTSGVGSFVVVVDGGKGERQPIDGLPKSFPVRTITGDDSLDDANYLELKEAWILANPGAYEQLNVLEEQPASRKPQSMEE